MNPIKKLAGQTAVYGLSTIVGRFLNFLLVPLYVYYFKTSEYGVITEFFAYITFLNIILTYGMETGYFKFAQSQKGNEIFSTSIISLFTTTSFFLLVILLFRHDIAAGMNYANHVEYIVYVALILAFDTLSAIPFANLRIKNKALKFSSLKVLNVVVNISFNLFFIVLCPRLLTHYPNSFINLIYNPSVGVGYIFISNLIASVVTFLIFIPQYLKINFKLDLKILKNILIYSLPLMVAGLAGNINDSIDRVIMKYFLPDKVNEMHQLGVYGASTKLAVIMILFIQMYRFAAEPFFFNHEKEENSKETFATITKYFTIFGLSVFLLVTLYLDIFKFFIPNKTYWEGLKVVPLALLANLLLGVYFNLSMWYKLTSQTKYGSRITIVAALFTIILNILLIGSMGYMACAWARLIGYLIMAILAYVYGQKYYPIKYDWKSIFTYTALALAIYTISTFTGLHNSILNILKNSLLLLTFLTFVIVKEKFYKRFYVKSKSS